MKISIMSDSHDHWVNLAIAIELSNAEGCELLLHAGDLIAPPGVSILEKFNGKVKFVWGNNEGEKMAITRRMDTSKNTELCGDIYEDTVDNTKVFMNHYPKIVELAYKTKEYDLCVYGHTHLYDERKNENSIIINPGEICGYNTQVSSFVIFDTKNKSVSKLIL